VIHLAAGVSGFVAAAVIGPRLQRDREVDAPNNLLMVATGAGLLWLGWNGFNGGDSYYAGVNASAAVLNTKPSPPPSRSSAGSGWTNLTGRKPSLIGSVNGMIVGLVAITPAAGFVNGWGASAIGIVVRRRGVSRVLLPQPPQPLPPRRRHAGRDLHPRVRRPGGRPTVGFLADPKMILYQGIGKTASLPGVRRASCTAAGTCSRSRSTLRCG